TDGSWQSTLPLTYNRQWFRCPASVSAFGTSCTPISGAETSSYTLTSKDVGFRVAFRVAAKTSVALRSATVLVPSVIAAARPVNTQAPSVTSSNGNLVATVGRWT